MRRFILALVTTLVAATSLASCYVGPYHHHHYYYRHHDWR